MTPCCGAGYAKSRADGDRCPRRPENRAMTKKTEVDATPAPLKPATQLVTGGRDTKAYPGFVNPPVHHASTVLYPGAADYLARRSRYVYGRPGTPTSEALATAFRS